MDLLPFYCLFLALLALYLPRAFYSAKASPANQSLGDHQLNPASKAGWLQWAISEPRLYCWIGLSTALIVAMTQKQLGFRTLTIMTGLASLLVAIAITKHLYLRALLAFIAMAWVLYLHAYPPGDLTQVSILEKAPIGDSIFQITRYARFDLSFLACFAYSLFFAQGLAPLNFRTVLRSLWPIPLFVLMYFAFSFSLWLYWEPKLDAKAIFYAFFYLVSSALIIEVFSRGLIQDQLEALLGGPFRENTYLALVITAIVTAAWLSVWSNFPRQPASVFLTALICGLAYGLSRRIEAAILTHWLMHAVHLLLFTYPD